MKNLYKIITITFFVGLGSQYLAGSQAQATRRLGTILEHITPKKILGNRPSKIQDAVNKAFEKIDKTKSWVFNGSYHAYGLLNLNDNSMLKRLAFVNQEKKDIYII